MLSDMPSKNSVRPLESNSSSSTNRLSTCSPVLAERVKLRQWSCLSVSKSSDQYMEADRQCPICEGGGYCHTPPLSRQWTHI